MDSFEDVDWHDLVTKFWEAPTTTQEDREALIRFLEARPNREEAKPYITDVERRLAITSEIQRVTQEHGIHGTYLTSQLWAFLLVIPLDLLEQILQQTKDPGIFDPLAPFKMLSNQLPTVFETFLPKSFSGIEVASYRRFTKEPERKARRSKKKAQETRTRDQKRCIVTSACLPSIVHIYPFVGCEDPNRTETVLDLFSPLYGVDMTDHLKDLLTSSALDHPSNMLAMDPLLHRWWNRAFFGLEPLDKNETTVRLKFHWLFRTGLEVGQRVDLATNPYDLLAEIDGVRMRNSKTGRPILTGEIIEITAQEPSLLPDMDILKLQWDLCRMCSLCGAGEVGDEPKEEDEEEEEEEEGEAEGEKEENQGEGEDEDEEDYDDYMYGDYR